MEYPIGDCNYLNDSMLRIESTMVSLPRDTIIQYQTHLLTLVILTIRMSITIIQILRQVVDFYLIHKPQNPKSQNPNTRIFKRLKLHTFTTYQMCKSILQYDNFQTCKDTLLSNDLCYPMQGLHNGSTRLSMVLLDCHQVQRIDTTM